MSNLIVFDRSRAEAWQRCPRLRWWAYEYQGRGIEPIKSALAPLVGQLVHQGLAALLTGYIDVDAAVVLAFTTSLPDDPQREEQQAFIEAAIRAYAAVRLPFPHQILSVEQEEFVDFDYAGRKLRMLTRSDVVERHDTGEVYIRNFKTAKEPDSRWAEQWRYDQQTLTECLAVERRLGQKVAGVIVEGIRKGSETPFCFNCGKGRKWGAAECWECHQPVVKIHDSPLLYCWTKEAEPPFPADFSPEYMRGWKKIAVWQKYPGGIAAWIKWLALAWRRVLAEQFVELPPILRSDWEINEWQEAVLQQEYEIRSKVAETYHPLNLNRDFPKHTGHGNCIRPSHCPMFRLCWGPQVDDPFETGEYRWRTPNHPEEIK